MRIFQIQRLTAVALLFFLTVHMVVVHYPPGHIDFHRVMERLQYPIWKAIDIAFLFCVLLHALTGMYSVITDYDKVTTLGLKKPLAILGSAAGIMLFFYGTITILSFQIPA